jgi:hypothetical protein
MESIDSDSWLLFYQVEELHSPVEVSEDVLRYDLLLRHVHPLGENAEVFGAQVSNPSVEIGLSASFRRRVTAHLSDKLVQQRLRSWWGCQKRGVCSSASTLSSAGRHVVADIRLRHKHARAERAPKASHAIDIPVHGLVSFYSTNTNRRLGGI